MNCAHPNAPRRTGRKACRACEVEANRRRRAALGPVAKLRNTYYGMMRRCYDRNHTNFKNYGAIGVGVCNRWRGADGLKNFMKDVPLPPTKKHTLDRIRPDRGYSKKNVRWATLEEQGGNQRRSVRITANGMTMHAAAWARFLGLDYRRLTRRIAAGVDPEVALGLKHEEGVPF